MKINDIMEAYRNNFELDLNESLKYFYKILDVEMMMYQSIADSKMSFETWETHADGLLSKFTFHSLSFHNLMSGFEISSTFLENGTFKMNLLDIPSSKVMLRAMIECYLTLHYLYFNPKDIETKRFRVIIWEHAGLISQLEYPTNTETGKQEREKLIERIEQSKNEILQNSKFKEFNSKSQKQILNYSKPRLFNSWKDLINESGFKEESILLKMYQILSNNAHSEKNSVNQIKAIQHVYDDKNKQAINLVRMGFHLASSMIVSLKSNYKITEIQFNGINQALAKQIIWNDNIFKKQ